MALSGLSQLRTLVIDKRPPFQQQLPAQQAAINISVTTPVLAALSKSWLCLEKLQLGLARSDFGTSPLEGLAGFTNLRSLSVHCYDQGYDDGHFMLPINVATLPTSLVKLDLMHAELFSGSANRQGMARKAVDGSRHNGCGAGSSSGLKSYNSVGLKSFSSGCCSSACDNSSHGSSSSSSSAGRNRVAFGAASAFTSMLSESFSLLSRQASAECSTAYLDRILAQQELNRTTNNTNNEAHAGPSSPQPAAATLSGTSVRGLGLMTAVSGAGPLALSPSLVLAHGSLTEPTSSGWLQELVGEEGTSGASRQDPDSRSSSNSREMHRQQSLPPLPRQQSLLQLPGHITPSKRPQGGSPTQSSSGPAVGTSCGPVMMGQQGGPRPRLQNPFAAAAAAAAVHAAMGGCVAAVDPLSPEAVAAAAAAPQLLPLMTEPAGAAAGGYRTSGKSGGLGMSFSMSFGSKNSKSSKASMGAAAASSAVASGELSGHAWQAAVELPLLQHLQLKHCALDGVSMDDIVTAPAVRLSKCGFCLPCCFAELHAIHSCIRLLLHSVDQP